MVLVFTGFASIFIDMGLGSALIQKKDVQQIHINTVFFINLAVGALLTILMYFGADFIAKFYTEPKLTQISKVLSFNFFLSSLSSVQRSLISKSLDMKKLSQVDIGTNLLAGAICILLAYLGYGVWSLVCNYLIVNLISAVFVWSLSPWKPRLQFSKSAFRELSGYSGNLLGFGILNYWVRNLDNLLIGKYVGTSALGVYTKAYSLMLLPITQITSVISRVMFPALSAMQDDKEKVRSVYLRTIGIIAFITFPLMVGLFVVAEYFILTVYGKKWIMVVPILKILCVVGLVQSVTTTTGWIFNSQGKTNIQFRWAIFTSIFRCVSFVIGLRWGVLGIANTYMIGTLILMAPSLILAGNVINLSFKNMTKALLPILFISVFMGVCVYGLRLLLSNLNLHHIVCLVILSVFGGGIYVALAIGFKTQPFKEMLALYKKKKFVPV